MRYLSRLPMIGSAAAFVALALATATAAAEPPGDGWTTGVELMALERSYGLGGSERSVTGALAGVQASYQRFPAFRVEARLLAGGAESEGAGDSASDPVGYAEGTLTWGLPLPDRSRLYGGVGAEYFRAQLDPDGEDSSAAVYLPIGISKAGDLHGGWRALTALEARFLVGARHRVEAPSGESGVFDAFGGFGGELSARFSHPQTPVQIEPYLRFLVAADSRSDEFAGSEVRVEDFTQTAVGVRLGANF